MKILTRTALFLVGVLIMTSSCVSSKKHKDLIAEKDALMNRFEKCNDEKKELATQIRGLEDDKSKMKTDLANKDRDLTSASKKLDDCNNLSEQRAAQLNAVKMQIEKAVSSLSEAGINVEEKNVKLYISLASNILYKPGSAKISKDGKEIVSKLAEVFKNNPTMDVTVEGHTDSSPIRRSRYLFSDNWDLSTARASEIVRELVKAGVDEGKLTASGRADKNKEVDTEEGKDAGAMNRRIEFIISPTSEALTKLAN